MIDVEVISRSMQLEDWGRLDCGKIYKSGALTTFLVNESLAFAVKRHNSLGWVFVGGITSNDYRSIKLDEIMLGLQQSNIEMANWLLFNLELFI